MVERASDFENQYKVRLQVANNYPGLSADIGKLKSSSVSFKVAPEVTENRNVTYKTLDPLHMPGQIYVYGGTSSRTFQLSNIRLISRTSKEASENMQTLHLLRSWTMPYFGNSGTFPQSQIENRESTVQNSSNTSAANTAPQGKNGLGSEMLGAPPDVLLLSAYAPAGEYATQGKNQKRRKLIATNIQNVPVLITNLTIPYPTDVDYIPTEDEQPMPRIMTLDIQLAETHSPQEYNKFSLQDFRQGKLNNF